MSHEPAAGFARLSNAYACDARDGLYADLQEFVHVHGTCGEMRATSCWASIGVHLGVFCSCGGRFDGWLSVMAATALHLYTAIPLS